MRGQGYEDDVPPMLRPDDTGGRRVALVIGNGRYAAEHDALINPPNDARAVAETLTRIGFAGVRQTADQFHVDFTAAHPAVEPLFDLDYRQLGRALAALERASASARQAVIYYAGHGIEVDGENYLLPVDTRLAHRADVKYEAHPLARALDAIAGATGLRLVILDACRNNPFRARLFGGRDAAGGGLRSIEPPGNVLVAYAAKHGSVASDGQQGASNSPFAAALLSHIERPGLEVVDLFREVKDDVLDATGGSQEPHLYGSLGRRREYFVLPSAPVEPEPPIAPPPVDDRTLEHTFWNDVKGSSDPAELEEFLAKFPAGVFAGVAHERAKVAIDATTNANGLRRLLQRYPESPRQARMRERLASLEWPLFAKSLNADELGAFAREFAGLKEADQAQRRITAMTRTGSKDGAIGRMPAWGWLAGGISALALVAWFSVPYWSPRSPTRPITASSPSEAELEAAARKSAEAEKAKAAAEAEAKIKADEAERKRHTEIQTEADRKIAEANAKYALKEPMGRDGGAWETNVDAAEEVDRASHPRDPALSVTLGSGQSTQPSRPIDAHAKPQSQGQIVRETTCRPFEKKEGGKCSMKSCPSGNMLTFEGQCVSSSMYSQVKDFDSCDEKLPTKDLFFGKTYILFDTFSSGASRVYLNSFSVDFLNPYFLDKEKGRGKEFEWNPGVRKRNFRIEPGETLETITSTGNFLVVLKPTSRSVDYDFGVRYKISYDHSNTPNDKSDDQTYIACAYYRVVWCGDGITPKDHAACLPRKP